MPSSPTQVPVASAATTLEPTAVPLKAYGNNATVVCACGAIMLVRSMGDAGKGASPCACGRYLKGYPDGGARITHILVWERGNNAVAADYAIVLDPSLHQA